MASLKDIEGIGAGYAAKLVEAGVATVAGLLSAGATPKGRADLETKTGITGKLILQWVNHADLYRVKGVGSEYSDLLEAAGVDTVVELVTRKPENLYNKMVEVNAAKKLVRQLPTQAKVADWVAQAKDLPRVITY